MSSAVGLRRVAHLEQNTSSCKRVFEDDSINILVRGFFLSASYLLDPICKSHEIYRRIQLVDLLYPNQALWNLVRKITLCFVMMGCLFLALFTTLPGVGLRFLGVHLEKNPFLELQTEKKEKILDSEINSFSIFSWNICGIGGGYAITDGGVFPWPFRIEKMIQKMIRTDADVLCLFEVYDIQMAWRICDELKKHDYRHFYFNIGPKVIGVSSGIFVASKFSLKNPKFTLFPENTLVGRTKNTRKGIFSFDLVQKMKNFATIFATHLQHSEKPQFSSSEEIEARKNQMEMMMDRVVDKINSLGRRCIIVTGDLNLDDDEYERSNWHTSFLKKTDFKEQKTWGGDEFCARMVGKEISKSLNLDHTLLLNDSAESISSKLVEVGYDPQRFYEGALSDHLGVLSGVVLSKP